MSDSHDDEYFWNLGSELALHVPQWMRPGVCVWWSSDGTTRWMGREANAGNLRLASSDGPAVPDLRKASTLGVLEHEILVELWGDCITVTRASDKWRASADKPDGYFSTGATKAEAMVRLAVAFARASTNTPPEADTPTDEEITAKAKQLHAESLRFAIYKTAWGGLSESAKASWLRAARFKLSAPTPEDIDDLKRQWLDDPCWDIEDAEGCEAHREELLAWRKEIGAKWEREHAERLVRRHVERATFGIQRWKDAVMQVAIHVPDCDPVEFVDDQLAAMSRALTDGVAARNETERA